MSGDGGGSSRALYCSFCGRSQHEVEQLIAGQTAFMCDERVGLCAEVVRTERKNKAAKPDSPPA